MAARRNAVISVTRHSGETKPAAPVTASPLSPTWPSLLSVSLHDYEETLFGAVDIPSDAG